ncbi:asparaginase domain-containing protein [Maribacter luteus]|uniref:asparaginase domain-containing protein n=1 Tax=Maribacter luteus TaxID=2594478 RepID=UPI002491541C|nr:asparaginase domain-containing protein [Maribacter luteus]
MIKVFTTGGTIGGLEYANKKDRSLKASIDISRFLKTANISESYAIDSLLDKDSRHITLEDRELIRDRIKLSKEERIVITHGTYTMIDTAKYLGKLNLKKTIVITGSFILGSEKHSDAPFNLGFAIGALKFLENGVYIAMNGEVFLHGNVVKNVQENRFERNL